jgi:glycosyltransferase involved in cell wall biosynthesis
MAKLAVPEKLNILLTAFNFPILGRASDQGFLWPLAKGLAENGHKVTVIAAKSPLGKAEVLRDHVRVFYLHEGFPNLSHLPFKEAVFEKFQELQKTEAFHIVHSIDDSAYQIALNKNKYNLPVAYDVQATEISQIFNILGMSQETVRSQISTAISVTYTFLKTYLGKDRRILNSANGIFVTSPQQRTALERYYLYPDFHTYTVPYGLEIGNLTARENTSNLYQKLSLPEDSHIILTQSDMTDSRELTNIFLAFEKVAIKKPNAYLIVLGSGPLRHKIEFELLNLALGSKVIMPGSLKAEEVSEYVDLAHVYINLNSNTTGFESTMIEAMAQKKVIIGSEVSSIANVVEDGIDGFLLRPADTESLSALLLEIFSNILPVHEIGERARQKVVNIFDVKKMILALEEAYVRILQNSGIYK